MEDHVPAIHMCVCDDDMFCSFVGSCPPGEVVDTSPAGTSQWCQLVRHRHHKHKQRGMTCHTAFSVGCVSLKKGYILQHPPSNSDGLTTLAHDYSSWYLRVASASADAASSNRKHHHAGTSTRVSTPLQSSPSPPCNPARGKLPKERPSLTSRFVRIPTRRSFFNDLSVGASIPPQ